MALSAFNHINALFAGISSALVGVDVVKEYFATKFEEKSDPIKETLQESKRIGLKVERAMEIREKYNITIPTDDSLTANYLNEIDQTIKGIQKTREEKKSAQTVILENEKEVNKKLASRISLFTFMFFLSLLIASALNESKFLIEEKSDLMFLCHFEIFFFSLLVIILCILSIKRYRIKVKISEFNILSIVVIFFLVLVPSIFFTCHNPKIIPIMHINIIYFVTFPIVLFIASLPFLTLYFRYQFIIPRQLSINLYEYSTKIDEMSKKLDYLISMGTIRSVS